MERAGSSAGSMFGPGIYLAENASKSDECFGKFAWESGTSYFHQHMYDIAHCNIVV